MLLLWFLILEMKWAILWRGCRIICKRSVIRLCYMTTWTFLVLWSMPSVWKRQGLRGRVEMLREKDHLMEVLQGIGFRYKTSLGVRSEFQVKFLPNSQRLVVIGCLTLCLWGEKVLIHQPISQLGESMPRNTMVIALRGRTIVLVVVKKAQG